LCSCIERKQHHEQKKRECYWLHGLNIANSVFVKPRA
jgi:hypothetical protein